MEDSVIAEDDDNNNNNELYFHECIENKWYSLADCILKATPTTKWNLFDFRAYTLVARSQMFRHAVLYQYVQLTKLCI